MQLLYMSLWKKFLIFPRTECEQQHATKHSRFLHCSQMSFAQFCIVSSELFSFAFLPEINLTMFFVHYSSFSCPFMPFQKTSGHQFLIYIF